MFSILGRKGRGEKFCDGHSRRDFLTIGSLAMGGLALPDLTDRQCTKTLGSSQRALLATATDADKQPLTLSS